jgi:hypothetical protein
LNLKILPFIFFKLLVLLVLLERLERLERLVLPVLLLPEQLLLLFSSLRPFF